MLLQHWPVNEILLNIDSKSIVLCSLVANIYIGKDHISRCPFMSPGSSTVDENGSSNLLCSMAQRKQKIYKRFPTEVVAVQGISVMTNGEEAVNTITSKMEGSQ